MHTVQHVVGYFSNSAHCLLSNVDINNARRKFLIILLNLLYFTIAIKNIHIQYTYHLLVELLDKCTAYIYLLRDESTKYAINQYILSFYYIQIYNISSQLSKHYY